MKPNLVDIEEIIKPNSIILNPTINYDYSKIIFNVISILILILGGYVLYIRKKNKEKNKIEYQNKIKNLYKEINIYEKLLND